MPARKNSALQTSAISIVWPKSGCSTSPVMASSSSASAKVFAGISGRRADSPNSHAMRMTKAGLRNSDGWILIPSKTIQRRAPLTSAPNCSVAATNARLTKKTMTASRRMWRGGRNEVANITASAGIK